MYHRRVAIVGADDARGRVGVCDVSGVGSARTFGAVRAVCLFHDLLQWSHARALMGGQEQRTHFRRAAEGGGESTVVARQDCGRRVRLRDLRHQVCHEAGNAAAELLDHRWRELCDEEVKTEGRAKETTIMEGTGKANANRPAVYKIRIFR